MNKSFGSEHSSVQKPLVRYAAEVGWILLMTGQTRVGDLDMSTTEVEG